MASQKRSKRVSKGAERRPPYVLNLAKVNVSDIPSVGGKNASLGEMLGKLGSKGIRVPPGFATTAAAYWAYVDANGLRGLIANELKALKSGKISLETAGAYIRALIQKATFPADFKREITKAYADLCRATKTPRVAVAVRSSATAEDLPNASFAGQQETFLNITGVEALLEACRRCLASLFNDRAIAYREHNGFDHMKVALSIGVQQMVRSDKAGAGVMFTLDTETGFTDVVRIDAAWGLGELVVKGTVNPDSYMVFKPLLKLRGKVPIIEKTLGQKSRKMIYAKGAHPTHIEDVPAALRDTLVLNDAEIVQLARWAVVIERHYGRPMDIEWAKDGLSGKLFIVQARPETVQVHKHAGLLTTHRIKRAGRKLLSGLAIGEAVAVGKVCKLRDPHDVAKFPKGAILVTKVTDPDWVPVMRRASAIITEHGGRTSHAAIVSREFGLPALIGVAHASDVLSDGQEVTVSCAEGDEGHVYDGLAQVETKVVDPKRLKTTRTQIMLNVANPAAAMRWWRLPAGGIGLARMEFIINNHIKIHPMALVRFNDLKDKRARREIETLTRGYTNKSAYFVDRLALGIGRIAASQYPRPVILRMSDFKTNEYAKLIGGQQFEPEEANPMIGWRGASRYYSPDYREGFALECRAVAKARDQIGLKNIVVMIPFCRTLEEADQVLATMAKYGLKRGRDGLEVYVMCEIPSNVILASAFADRFDGFSIGSNDLTQLTLGVDRDSDRLAPLFSEENAAVTTLIRNVITAAHKKGRKVGLCGQAPSDRPDFARLLVDAGIDSISITPDSFLAVNQHVAAAEKARKKSRARRARRN